MIPFTSKTSACALSFRDWTGGRDLVTVGTNSGSVPIPFQRWRTFKEAFAPELVAEAVAEMPRPVRHIVDPFGGSGTTALAAQFLGVRPTTIEVNPYLADLIESKLVRYDIDEVRDSYAWLIDDIHKERRIQTPHFPGAPETFVEPGVGGRYLFSKAVAHRIALFNDGIARLTNADVRRLFRVILGSVLVPLSNVVISGKGRRYRRGWKAKEPDHSRLDSLFQQSAELVIYDLHRYAARLCREYTLLRGDARNLLTTIDEADLAVFSPPYPNSFDYTDVYNLELWALGYLDSSAANLKLRRATLRSHVQICRDMSGVQYPSTLLEQSLDKLTRVRDRLWNRRIPDMISAYISDMGSVLSTLKAKLATHGRVYMVVGDSRYGGVHVPTAAILADIAPAVGFSVRRSTPFRSMRVSPQQGGQRGLEETLLVLQRS
jgi:hypothetical protein